MDLRQDNDFFKIAQCEHCLSIYRYIDKTLIAKWRHLKHVLGVQNFSAPLRARQILKQLKASYLILDFHVIWREGTSGC